MPRLEKETSVRRFRREVYDFLIDLNTRRLYFPEDFRNFRIASATPRGVGASVSFDVELGKVHAGEATVTGVLPPEGVTEIFKAGPVRATLRYGLEEKGDATLVRLIADYRVLGIVSKLLDPVLYAPAMQRWHARMLERLRAAIEGETAEETATRLAHR
jgi:hypothetical protein